MGAHGTPETWISQVTRGPYRLSAAVMTHPKRLDAAIAIARAVPRPEFQLVQDPQPHGPSGSLRTAVKAWSAADPSATHHLVVQDDALLCEDFERRLHRALRAWDHGALALNTTWNSWNGSLVTLGAVTGAAIMPALDEGWTPSVGLVMPVTVAREFAGYCETQIHDLDLPDDAALCRFFTVAGVPTALSVPNLVEHAGRQSLVGNGSQGSRRSACFLSDPPSTARSDAAIGRLPETIPHLHKGVAYCLVRQARPDMYARVHHGQWLAEQGLPAAGLRLLFGEDLSRLPAPSHPLLLDEELSWAYWITAYLMGRLADPALASPQVRREALARLARGGLWPRASESTLADAQESFADLGELALVRE
ncbi:hypothetical protein ACIBHY_04975 [Nonomuraea sp. NPDC050547]|uniref:hypothetical protein n=1 Tax=unclassified Nonomuraea TaxID=2593643 RepID=UPI00378EFB53